MIKDGQDRFRNEEPKLFRYGWNIGDEIAGQYELCIITV